MEGFAGAQSRSHTIEIIIDHGIDFKILELKREWGKIANEIHLYENKNIPLISSQRVSLYMLPLDTHREGPHLLIREKSWRWICAAYARLLCGVFSCKCVCDIHTLQAHLQYQTSEELSFSRVQIVLLPAKCSLSYLWMRALWHLATALIEHRCEPYSVWTRSKGRVLRLVSDLQVGVWMQWLDIELPR